MRIKKIFFRAFFAGPKNSFFFLMIFAFGGWQSGSVVSAEVYRLQGNAWLRCAPQPVPLKAYAAVLVEGNVWILGGSSIKSGPCTADVLVYSAATDSWSAGPPLPRPRHRHAAVVVTRTLFVLGGLCDGGVLADTMDMFDLDTKQWSTVAVAWRRYGMAVVSLREGFYVIGGAQDRTTKLSSMLHYGMRTKEWTTCAPMREARMDHAAVGVDDRVFVVGGSNEKGLCVNKDVEMYDAATGIWRVIGACPEPRTALALVCLGRKLYVLGGITQTTSASVSMFDLETKQWETGVPLPEPRKYFVALLIPPASSLHIGTPSLRLRLLVLLVFLLLLCFSPFFTSAPCASAPLLP